MYSQSCKKASTPLYLQTSFITANPKKNIFKYAYLQMIDEGWCPSMKYSKTNRWMDVL